MNMIEKLDAFFESAQKSIKTGRFDSVAAIPIDEERVAVVPLTMGPPPICLSVATVFARKVKAPFMFVALTGKMCKRDAKKVEANAKLFMEQLQNLEKADAEAKKLQDGSASLNVLMGLLRLRNEVCRARDSEDEASMEILAIHAIEFPSGNVTTRLASYKKTDSDCTFEIQNDPDMIESSKQDLVEAVMSGWTETDMACKLGIMPEGLPDMPGRIEGPDFNPESPEEE